MDARELGIEYGTRVAADGYDSAEEWLAGLPPEDQELLDPTEKKAALVSACRTIRLAEGQEAAGEWLASLPEDVRESIEPYVQAADLVGAAKQEE